ncbi:MAG TPA: nuclear transport factor 2 family protein [Candidatus Sulfotelmatobacter sp.]|nr:nuclear transport factor 2 family protein [Candidatus Sulfotelmatobacter sp.]
MKRLATGLGLSLLLFFNLPTHAQDNRMSSNDANAVRAAVTNYIEAYYTGNAARMQQTIHPDYLKQMVHGDIQVREKTGQQMVEEVRSHGPADLSAAQKTEQVSVLDIAGTIASAKLVTPGWVDYMTLFKVNGEWKILSVVQRIDR